MYHKAKIQAEANELLLKDGLISPVTTRISQVEADGAGESQQDRAGEAEDQGRTRSTRRSTPSRPASRRRKRCTTCSRSEADALKVRAGIEGVLQVVPVQVGQRVPAGTNLARVAVPGRLKAELRIPETQARDIEIGQKATVDTRNGEVEGRVSRIDPAAQNGTVRRGRLVHASPCPAAPGRT